MNTKQYKMLLKLEKEAHKYIINKYRELKYLNFCSIVKDENEDSPAILYIFIKRYGSLETKMKTVGKMYVIGTFEENKKSMILGIDMAVKSLFEDEYLKLTNISNAPKEKEDIWDEYNYR